MIANYHPNFWQFVSSMTADETESRPVSGDLSTHGDPFLVRQALRAINRSFNGRYFYYHWMSDNSAMPRYIVDSWACAATRIRE